MLGAETQFVPDVVHAGPDVVPVNPGTPPCGGKQSGQYGHRGRLSGPVVAQKRGYLPLVEVHRQPVQSLLAVAREGKYNLVAREE